MERLQCMGLAALAMLALSAITSVAHAETAPYFTIGGTRLIAGKTHNADSRVYKENSFTFINAGQGVKITCKALGTEGVVLSGSNAGSAGMGSGVGVFSQCNLEEGNGAPECELANTAGGAATTTIRTNPMKSELVENVVNSKGGKQLLREILPVNSETGFVTLFFTGAKCTVKEAIAAGSTVAEVRLDTLGEGTIELGQTPEQAASWLMRFPAVAITQVWLVSNGTGKVVKTGEISFGSAFTQTGTSLLLLANTKFEPERSAIWSPLP